MSKPGQNLGGAPGFLGVRFGFTLLAFLAAAGFLLWEEHEAHILGALPLLLLVGVCVGMHFFMHGGHGRERDDSADSSDNRTEDDTR